jgi:hypothetical protein
MWQSYFVLSQNEEGRITVYKDRSGRLMKGGAELTIEKWVIMMELNREYYTASVGKGSSIKC